MENPEGLRLHALLHDQILQEPVPSDVLDHLCELVSPGTILCSELVLDQSLSGKNQYKMQIVSLGWKSEAEA